MLQNKWLIQLNIANNLTKRDNEKPHDNLIFKNGLSI